jgi:hypothetical protein
MSLLRKSSETIAAAPAESGDVVAFHAAKQSKTRALVLTAKGVILFFTPFRAFFKLHSGAVTRSAAIVAKTKIELMENVKSSAPMMEDGKEIRFISSGDFLAKVNRSPDSLTILDFVKISDFTPGDDGGPDDSDPSLAGMPSLGYVVTIEAIAILHALAEKRSAREAARLVKLFVMHLIWQGSAGIGWQIHHLPAPASPPLNHQPLNAPAITGKKKGEEETKSRASCRNAFTSFLQNLRDGSLFPQTA